MLAYRCMAMVTKDRYEAPYPVSRLNQYGLHELFVYALSRKGIKDVSNIPRKDTPVDASKPPV